MEANAGEYIKKYLHLKTFPRISLHCKLVPVQYREYEYGLLQPFWYISFLSLSRHQREVTETKQTIILE